LWPSSRHVLYKDLAQGFGGGGGGDAYHHYT
jgi:hypothetical protein